MTAGRNGATLYAAGLHQARREPERRTTVRRDRRRSRRRAGQLTSGGGVGGVGGEGLGGAVTDQPTLTALGNPQNNGRAPGPLLSLSLRRYGVAARPPRAATPVDVSLGASRRRRCDPDQAPDDQRIVHLYGHVRAPAILTQTGGNYIRAPIPQDVWTMATETAGGPTPDGKVDQLVVSLRRRQERSGLRADQRDLDGRAGPARRHHLLQLVRHAARAEPRRRRRRQRHVRRRGAVDPRRRLRARSSWPASSGGTGAVPRVPLGRGGRLAPHRAARRQLRRELRLRPLAQRQHRDGDDATTPTFPGHVPRRLDGAHRERHSCCRCPTTRRRSPPHGSVQLSRPISARRRSRPTGRNRRDQPDGRPAASRRRSSSCGS